MFLFYLKYCYANYVSNYPCSFNVDLGGGLGVERLNCKTKEVWDGELGYNSREGMGVNWPNKKNGWRW